jgi:hypothetical protein
MVQSFSLTTKQHQPAYQPQKPFSEQGAHRSAMSIATLTTNYMLSSKIIVKVRYGWKKPPEGKLMVNVDASFDSGLGSAGVIIRDAGGGFVAAATKFLSHVVDAQLVEAYAMKEGLLLAQHIVCNSFILQSDCLEVVETMKEGGFSATAAAAIFDECYNLWKDQDAASMEHCDRDANKVAHELAWQAFCTKDSCIWVDNPPSFILNLLVNDVTFLPIQ